MIKIFVLYKKIDVSSLVSRKNVYFATVDKKVIPFVVTNVGKFNYIIAPFFLPIVFSLNSRDVN